MGKFLLEIRGTKYIYGRTRPGGNGEGVLSHCNLSLLPSHLSDYAFIISTVSHTRSIRCIDHTVLPSDTSRYDACVSRCGRHSNGVARSCYCVGGIRFICFV